MPTTLTNLDTALTTFAQNDLRTAATNLLATLGYESKRVLRLDEPTAEGFKQKFDIKSDQFNDDKALISQWDEFEFLFQLSDSEVRRTLTLFNQIEPGQKNSFFFHALRLKPRATAYARTELADITRQLNRPFGVPTVVLIQYGDYLTMGVIARRTHKHDATRDVLEKVTLIKDICLSQPHPAHLRILHGLTVANLPAQNFDEVLKCWQTTLNIRELNERFYKELSAWYYVALSRIKLPVRSGFHQTDAENRQHFTLRLICRTLFCWFLKEKGLIDRQLLELYDSRDLPVDLLPGVENDEFAAKNSYYRGVLQNVFFACLNQPMGTARAKYYLGKSYLPATFNYDLFGRIPYLNGGLFDKLLEDNASDAIDDSPNFQIPNELFYARSLTIGSGNKTLRTQGLNRILNSYKFTIDENTPLEEDVALDPELLGMVFENLLAETDPDENTAKTARKASGSFYTPRRVIDYMVNESLVLYLNTYASRHNKVDAPTRERITRLVYENQSDPTEIAFNEWVVDALDDLKMLDPACGSGAFPMGMLNRIVALLRVVDAGNRLWIDKQVLRLPPELREQTRRELTRHDQDYARKIGLIRNAIYGVDILPMASVLTKLRFFISLLIEQRIDLTATASNYNISPLPNLETKIICANTLTDVAPSVFDQSTIDQLELARERYYGQNRTAAEKETIAIELAEHLDTLYNYEQFGQKINKTKYTDAASKSQANRQLLREWFQHGNITAPFFNVAAFFPELRGRGFDLVMGNPPYGGNSVSDGVKTALVLGSKDPYGAFMARFLGDGQRATPLREGGVLAFIVSDTFMTIKSHLPLRKQLLNHRLHQLIRVHPDTFRATVNTAIVLVQKCHTKPLQRPAPLTDGHEVLMADLTNVSIHDQYDRFLGLLNETRLSNVA